MLNTTYVMTTSLDVIQRLETQKKSKYNDDTFRKVVYVLWGALTLFLVEPR